MEPITMKRVLLACLIISGSAWAQNFAYNGQCSKGGQAVVTQGQKSKGTVPITGGATALGSGVLASYPSCTVTVYLSGTVTRATIFSTASGSSLVNPFTANVDGSFLFFAAPGMYDVTISGMGLPSPFTTTAIVLGGSTVWGSITGTLSNQTDLQNALNLLAPLDAPVFTTSVNLSYITGATFQCLQADAFGNVSGTGLACGSGGGGGAVSSVFTRTGAVVATTGDYTVAQVTGAAPLASPTFTGTVAGIDATITGTLQTLANWSVPAGAGAGQWGTSPSVATCSGDSRVQQCTITVGSGTVGANPVLTVTQPTAFFFTPSCDAQMIGGTAAFSNFTTGTVTTTSAPFTWGGSTPPVASTTIVLKVSCSN